MGTLGSNECLFFEDPQLSVSLVSYTHGLQRAFSSGARAVSFLLGWVLIFPSPPPLQRARSGWPAAAAPTKAGWKCITMETGAQCAMMAGQTSVPRWSAGSWASGRVESVHSVRAS